MTMENLSQAAVHWLANGKRGVSSNAMFTVLTGIEARGTYDINSYDHPWDVFDFYRCELLLRHVPELRRHLSMMTHASLEWRNLVREWDEIVRLMEEEAPGVFSDSLYSMYAPKAQALIKSCVWLK